MSARKPDHGDPRAKTTTASTLPSVSERIIAAVAWCAHHNATVRFRHDAVRVKVGNRTAAGASLLDAVAQLWPEMPT